MPSESWRVPTQEEIILIEQPLVKPQHTTLDEFINGLDFVQAQVKVDRDIRNLTDAGKDIYNRPNGTLTPVQQILEKKIGNCEDGTALMAAILSKYGFEVKGMIVDPISPKDDGHMVCIYKNPADGKWGVAGKQIEDFFPPIFESLEEIAEGVTFQHNWSSARTSIFDLDISKLLSSPEPITYSPKPLCDIDLTQKYGLAFGKIETKNGEITAKITPKGWTASWTGLLVIPGHNGVITDARFTWHEKDKSYQISLKNKQDHFSHKDLTIFTDTKLLPTAITIIGDDPRCTREDPIYNQFKFAEEEKAYLSKTAKAVAQLTGAASVSKAYNTLPELRTKRLPSSDEQD